MWASFRKPKSDSAEIAKERLNLIVAIDRGNYIPGRLEFYNGGLNYRVVFDKPITVRPNEFIDLHYDFANNEFGAVSYKESQCVS